jgi:hypothetical protein
MLLCVKEIITAAAWQFIYARKECEFLPCYNLWHCAVIRFLPLTREMSFPLTGNGKLAIFTFENEMNGKLVYRSRTKCISQHKPAMGDCNQHQSPL